MQKSFNSIKYIAFDLDGTLVDSAPDLAEAVRTTLLELGLESVTDDEVRGWIGNGAEIMLKRALSKDVIIDPNLDEALYEIARTRFDEHYAKNGSKKTSVYPKVKETLQALKQAGFKMGVVTNKPIAFVPAILTDLGLDDYFSDLIGGDSFATNKPAPEGLLFLKDKYELAHNEILMVGDSKNDILAAQNANINSIGLTYGYNYGESIADSNPSCVLDKFADLLAILPFEKNADNPFVS